MMTMLKHSTRAARTRRLFYPAHFGKQPQNYSLQMGGARRDFKPRGRFSPRAGNDAVILTFIMPASSPGNRVNIVHIIPLNLRLISNVAKRKARNLRLRAFSSCAGSPGETGGAVHRARDAGITPVESGSSAR